MPPVYEDQTHPSNRQFWEGLNQNPGHPFSKSALTNVYGHDLSKQSFGHTFGRVEQNQLPQPTYQDMHAQVQQLGQLIAEVQQRQAPHGKVLEELAKDVTVRLWGIPRDLLDASLGNPEHNAVDEWEQEEELDFSEIDPETQSLVNKRIFLESMAQGAGIHQMMTAHHIPEVRQVLDRLDPALAPIYNKITSYGHTLYWTHPNLIELFGGGGASGSVKIEYDDQDQPTVKASAVDFPVLVQELNKGAAQLASMHAWAGVPPQQLQKVMALADDPLNEHWEIQIGPELWRKFLRAIPRGESMGNVMMRLSKMPPEQVEQFGMRMMDQMDKASEMMQQPKVQEPEPEQWNEDQYEDGPEYDLGLDYDEQEYDEDFGGPDDDEETWR